MFKKNIIWLFLILSLTWCFWENTKEVPQLSSEQYIEKLSQLWYFKYVETEEIDRVKEEMSRSFTKYNTFFYSSYFDYNDKIAISSDYRSASFDIETIGESGWIKKSLDRIAPIFERVWAKFSYTEDIDIFEDNHYVHKIILNQTEYIIYDGDISDFEWPRISTINFLEMVNTELKKQWINEKLYLFWEWSVILLSDEIHDFILPLCSEREYPNNDL